METPAATASDGIAGLLQRGFETAEDAFYLVNPSAGVLEELVTSLDAPSERKPDVRLLGSDAVLRDVMDDFLVAGRTADLVADGTLSLRTLESSNGHEPDLLVTDSAVTTILRADGRFATVQTDDEEFVDAVRTKYDTLFEESDPYDLRTPSLGRIEATLESELGPACREDFGEFLSNLQTARGDGDGPDEVTISLLVAARNRVQFYDLARWAEEVGLASKATFSRKKTRLEERGLLATENVPSDVGRPRLRLVLGEDRLRDASVAQLASVVQSAGK